MKLTCKPILSFFYNLSMLAIKNSCFKKEGVHVHALFFFFFKVEKIGEKSFHPTEKKNNQSAPT